MPLYEFHCEVCALYAEQIQGIHETHEAFCQGCGEKMHRVYSPPYLMGDLPNTGATVMGYDDSLGCEVRGKAHQKELMRQKGLVEYQPDPKMEQCRNELRYIGKHEPGPAGRAAAQKVHQEMGQTRRKRAVRDAWDRAAQEKG